MSLNPANTATKPVNSASQSHKKKKGKLTEESTLGEASVVNAALANQQLARSVRLVDVHG
ncbi:hypothetical protein NX059_004847 [Plenodomus lindquistii]|nr:hypothetical protein NX059_004847 [Plenodomus lindquistii]